MHLSIAIIILVLLLLGPLFFRVVEENLEAYCFVLGIVAIGLSGGLDWHLAERALSEPIPISIAVLVAGLLFRYGRPYLDSAIESMSVRLSRPLLSALIVAVVALVSSVITSIVAALVLVEALRSLRLPQNKLVLATIVGCMAIGLGASLTPLGEPLSTIAVDALNLEFFGLFSLLAPYVLPGIVACSVIAALFARGQGNAHEQSVQLSVGLGASFTRAIKVFAFIAGLVLLGEAYAPLAGAFVHDLSPPALFWANVAGAALDNATVIAIEIHGMPLIIAREVILSLLASGAMLIQGNIPNIIGAGALGISAAQWARVGIPLGLVFLLAFFFSLRLAG
jgi:predicted cation transporter